MTEKTDIVRLDYSKPPPGYTAWTFRGASIGGQVYQTAEGEQIGTLKMAWAHYKDHNDPPGLLTFNEPEQIPGGVWMVDVLGEGGRFADYRAQDEARAAAWAWYGRRHALAERLHDGVWCPECYSDDAHVVALDAKTTSQPWCTECDVEMGGICEDVWPHCLVWSDAQVAEVERWLQDSTAEMPDVLHG